MTIKSYCFDWDDNIMIMPSNAMVYRRLTADHIVHAYYYFRDTNPQNIFSSKLAQYPIDVYQQFPSLFIKALPINEHFNIPVLQQNIPQTPEFLQHIDDPLFPLIKQPSDDHYSFMITHQPGCCFEQSHKPPIINPDQPTPQWESSHTTCDECDMYSVAAYISAALYGQVRHEPGRIYTRTNTFDDFWPAGLFLSQLFDGLTQQQQGFKFYPRNMWTTKSLYSSFLKARAIVNNEPCTHDDDDDNTVAKQQFDFLDLFRAPSHLPDTNGQYYLESLTPTQIYTNLAWLFDDPHFSWETYFAEHHNRPNHEQIQHHSSFGASAQHLLKAIVLNRPLCVITSRGQPSWSIIRGLLALVLYLLTDEELLLLQHHTYKAGFQCICHYFQHIPIFAVHSRAFSDWLALNNVETSSQSIIAADINTDCDSNQSTKYPLDITTLAQRTLELVQETQISAQTRKSIAMLSFLHRLLTVETVQASTGFVACDNTDYNTRHKNIVNYRLQQLTTQFQQHQSQNQMNNQINNTASAAAAVASAVSSFTAQNDPNDPANAAPLYANEFVIAGCETPYFLGPKQSITDRGLDCRTCCYEPSQDQINPSDGSAPSSQHSSSQFECLNGCFCHLPSKPIFQQQQQQQTANLQLQHILSPFADTFQSPREFEPETLSSIFNNYAANGHELATVSQLPLLSSSTALHQVASGHHISSQYDSSISISSQQPPASIASLSLADPLAEAPYCLGFSDDDVGNLTIMSTMFTRLAKEYPQVKFVVYDSSNLESTKKTIIQ